MLQGCRLFKQYQNLPTGHCVAGLQAIQVVSEPTWLVLCSMGAVCLSGVGTYLPGTVLQGMQAVNPPAGHCFAGGQAV